MVKIISPDENGRINNRVLLYNRKGLDRINFIAENVMEIFP